MQRARSIAHSNIALVKYWGKRVGVAPELNLPAVSSLSLTLSGLRTETVVSPAAEDAFLLNGTPAGPSESRKVFAHLDRLFAYAEGRLAPGSKGGPRRPAAQVLSVNHFPTKAGLASSASGFAALTLAGAAAYGLEASRSELSALARQGSGSAARSLFGGWVRLDRGERTDGSDCVARPLFGPDHWDVRLVVIETASGSKGLGSTEAMERCRTTSPYYPAWVETSEADLAAATETIRARDLHALGEVMEHSCFKMHASMMASKPPILYWNGVTLDVLRRLFERRLDTQLAAYATSDAGPHVKILVGAADAARVEEIVEPLRAEGRVRGVSVLEPGPDASVEVMSP